MSELAALEEVLMISKSETRSYISWMTTHAALAADPTAEVAMVYSLPANEVATPAPEEASVIASPPAEVTIVNADPPMLVTSVAIAPPATKRHEYHRSCGVGEMDAPLVISETTLPPTEVTSLTTLPTSEVIS